jgi:small subunit ribosomal protein S17
MTGTVVSNKMNKALVVSVISLKIHQKYKKRFKTRKRYSVACADSSQFEIGQTVEIESCRPISKTIHFKIVD